MLLLLLSDLKDVSDLPNQTRLCKIEDLFEVSVGVLEDRCSKTIKNLKEPLIFLRASSFDENGVLVDLQKLNAINKSIKTKRNSKLDLFSSSAIDENLITLGIKKILKSEDYLIYTRGIPKGFSLLKSNQIDKINAVANHQFVCLRPRTDIQEIHVPYLHFILDLLIENEFKAMYDYKLKKFDGKYGLFNSISTKEIRNIELEISDSKESQIKIYNRYNEIYNAYKQAIFRLDLFKNAINIQLKSKLIAK